MKIVRYNCRIANVKRFDPIGFHRNHIIDILQPAFEEEESPANNGEAILLEDIGRYDRV